VRLWREGAATARGVGIKPRKPTGGGHPEGAPVVFESVVRHAVDQPVLGLVVGDGPGFAVIAVEPTPKRACPERPEYALMQRRDPVVTQGLWRTLLESGQSWIN
jgi:hypothetical protein